MSYECAQAPTHFRGLIGESPSMQVVYDQIHKAASLKSSVLITGETGTGKELVAAAIHLDGLRRYNPFVPIDCPSLSPHLFETEMFGCEQGAYTSATGNRIGLMLAAGNGSILFDEIGDLRADLQVKILRTIQQREVRPVGSNQWIPIHARFMAATNCDLEQAVANGTFRQELFFRLNVVQVRLPPLRERKGDIPLLAEFFATKFSTEQGKHCSISPRAIESLTSHLWPGNIRELQHVVQRAVALEDGPVLEFADFEPKMLTDAAARSMILPWKKVETMAAAKRRAILDALSRTHGKICPAARALGMGKTTLYRILKEHRSDYAPFGPHTDKL